MSVDRVMCKATKQTTHKGLRKRQNQQENSCHLELLIKQYLPMEQYGATNRSHTIPWTTMSCTAGASPMPTPLPGSASAQPRQPCQIAEQNQGSNIISTKFSTKCIASKAQVYHTVQLFYHTAKNTPTLDPRTWAQASSYGVKTWFGHNKPSA